MEYDAFHSPATGEGGTPQAQKTGVGPSGGEMWERGDACFPPAFPSLLPFFLLLFLLLIILLLSYHHLLFLLPPPAGGIFNRWTQRSEPDAV